MRLIIMLFIVTAVASPAPTELNELLEERLKLNKQYKSEFVASTKGLKNEKRLAKYEAGVADSWVKLIEHVKESKDLKLKKLVLQLEYYDELRSYGYDLEYAESNADKKKASKGLDKNEKLLQQVQ